MQRENPFISISHELSEPRVLEAAGSVWKGRERKRERKKWKQVDKRGNANSYSEGDREEASQVVYGQGEDKQILLYVK